ITDQDKETYWTTDDGVTTGSLVVNLGSGKQVKYVLLQEYIRLGQRVKSFNVDVWKDNDWHTVATGTTVGYKRILPIEPVSTDRIRINITSSKACPLMSNVEVY
ncbi:MAG TPA: discoidin domain-containing protein, partial [Ohtaekwangia sp.]|nr:discoidin domain-containing protein [Ohtaekwangia sp.]